MANQEDWIPVNLPEISDEDIAAVVEVLSQGWVSGEGPVVEEFEETIARLTSRKHCVAVSNGSVALDLTLHGIGLGPGDEVILPAFTIISPLNQVLRSGATPVFVDSDSTDWNIKPDLIRAAITEKTKIIVVAHTYGLPCDMEEILSIADEFGLPVLEDAAEAHGLRYRGRACGSFGIASTLSFYANKNVTTGEGGAVLTDDDDLANRIRLLRNLSFSKEKRFVHHEIGWNQRLSSMQAALGLSQLKRLDATIQKRREFAAIYRGALSDIPGVKFAPAESRFGMNDYWVVGITLDSDTFGSGEKISSRLRESGVDTRPFFYPLNKQPVLERFGILGTSFCPVAEWLGSQGLYLPNGLGMSEILVQEAASRTRSVLESYG